MDLSLIAKLALRGLSLLYLYDPDFDASKHTGPYQYEIYKLPFQTDATVVIASGADTNLLLADLQTITDDLLDRIGEPWLGEGIPSQNAS